MKGRWSWKWFTVVATLTIVVAVQSAWSQQTPRHRVVVELTSDSPEQWQVALNNVENLQKAFGKDQIEIEVVAHGKGLGILQKTDTSAADRVASIAESGVRFAACQNTMRQKHLTKEDLLPVAQTVDSGVSEIVRKQEAGWSYLKAGS